VLIAEERKGPCQLVQVPLDRPPRDGVALVSEFSLHGRGVDLPGRPRQHPEYGQEAQNSLRHDGMIGPPFVMRLSSFRGRMHRLKAATTPQISSGT
jgi:hypothetical protein